MFLAKHRFCGHLDLSSHAGHLCGCTIWDHEGPQRAKGHLKDSGVGANLCTTFVAGRGRGSPLIQKGLQVEWSSGAGTLDPNTLSVPTSHMSSAYCPLSKQHPRFPHCRTNLIFKGKLQMEPPNSTLPTVQKQAHAIKVLHAAHGDQCGGGSRKNPLAEFCFRGGMGGGGVLEPKGLKVCVPKMAQINFSLCKISFFPTMKSGSEGG